jgi:predicted transcriptional regulator of viral defense system
MRKSFERAREIFLRHNGILKLSQAKKQGIDQKTLHEMLAEGLLVKETRGVFRLSDFPPLSNPDVIQVSIRVPSAVICLISALAFYNLTTQIPNRVYIALPRRTQKPRVEYPPIAVVWLSDKPYSFGIEKHEIDKVLVPIYSREKTVADCLKFRDKIGLNIALESLKFYLREPSPDIEKLLLSARVDRVETLMRHYVEAAL